MINYWAVPNMGKMHMMILMEINEKTYVKHGGKHYLYKQWHDPNNYSRRIEKSFICRKGQSKIETPIKTTTTKTHRSDAYANERHEYLDLAAQLPIDATKLHSNTSEVGGELMKKYFGSVHDRKPPEDFMKDKDPVEVFFTDKHWRGLQKVFPVSPSGSYFGTFLEPYLENNNELIMTIVDEILDCDILMSPFIVMGKYMLGHPNEKEFEKTELEAYVLKTYKSIKNVVPYKENLVDCFASKLKRIKKFNVLEEYKKDERRVWSHLDGIVRNVRRIEKYLQDNKIDPVYFNLDRDDYGEVFGFHNISITRDNTHPGDYPEREEFEKIAKEYVMMRDMRDMRRRNRLRDWL